MFGEKIQIYKANENNVLDEQCRSLLVCRNGRNSLLTVSNLKIFKFPGVNQREGGSR